MASSNSSTKVSFADAPSVPVTLASSRASEIVLSSGPASRVDTLSSGSASCVTLPSTGTDGTRSSGTLFHWILVAISYGRASFLLYSGGSPRDLHPVVLLIGDSNLKELKTLTFHDMLGLNVSFSFGILG